MIYKKVQEKQYIKTDLVIFMGKCRKDNYYLSRAMEEFSQIGMRIRNMPIMWSSPGTKIEFQDQLEKSLNGQQLAALIVMIASAVLLTALNVIDMAGAKKAGKNLCKIH